VSNLIRRIASRYIRAARFRRGDLATYKGKTYRIGFAGPTKFGDRAKLVFLDGSKEFWVDLSLVSPAEESEERVSWEEAQLLDEDMGIYRPDSYYRSRYRRG
jgi:hypothetical protein